MTDGPQDSRLKEDEESPLLSAKPVAFSHTAADHPLNQPASADSSTTPQHGTSQPIAAMLPLHAVPPLKHVKTGSHGQLGLLGDRAGGSKRPLGALAGVRSWLRVAEDGSTSMVQLERQVLEKELGVQLRDFRVLDAVLGTSYPSCLLVRPHALIINLEMCKCIISRTYALINNTDVDRVKPLLEALRDRLRPLAAINGGVAGAHGPSVPTASDSTPGIATASTAPTTTTTVSLLSSSHSLRPPSPSPFSPTQPQGDATSSHGLRAMPFELTVLEVCLEQVLHHLDRAAAELDASSRQAVDKLLHRLTAKSLERMRLLKNRIAAVQKKVVTSKELLRKLLEDDKTMAGMNLTARFEHEGFCEAQRSLLRQQSQLAVVGGGSSGGAGPDSALMSLGAHGALLQHLAAWQEAGHMSARWSSRISRGSTLAQLTQALSGAVDVGDDLSASLHHTPQTLPNNSSNNNNNPVVTPTAATASATAAAANLLLGGLGLEEQRMVEEDSAIVEMLLEAFYLQLDQTGNRLESCAQAIHDTEDFINIKLDQHRNQLISIELMVSIGALVLGACAVMTGVFGMNMPNAYMNSPHALVEITVWMVVMAVVVWGLIIWVAIRRGIITWVPWSVESRHEH